MANSKKYDCDLIHAARKMAKELGISLKHKTIQNLVFEIHLAWLSAQDNWTTENVE